MVKLRGLFLAVLVACGGAAGTGMTSTTSSTTDQVSVGARLYMQKCASCHGKRGEGTQNAPELAGLDALSLEPPREARLRRTEFRTAKDVFDFVKRYMPKDRPGSLTDDQVAAIVAFGLRVNDIDVGARHLDARSAATIQLHP